MDLIRQYVFLFFKFQLYQPLEKTHLVVKFQYRIRTVRDGHFYFYEFYSGLPNMITGDYGLTAISIARLIGMIDRDAGAEDYLLSGLELSKIDDGELTKRLSLGGPLIIARTAPEQKMRIVSCLKELGEIVAVTGDGVNDAAARSIRISGGSARTCSQRR